MKATNHKGESVRTLMLIFVVLLQVACFAKERFVLESELRTNFSGGGSISSLTAYHYDNDGNRIERRVFDGVDSTATLVSSVRYSYDAQGRCIEELLVDDGGDTLSIVRYTWGTDGMLSAATLRKDGSVRFADSLRYTDGLMRVQGRYNAAGELTWYHSYSYVNGLSATDSLYESNGGSEFVATQARIISHNADSTVASEAQWRVSGGQWYLISTKVMAYAQKILVAAMTYETDGASGRLIDSLAYTADSYGNRTFEAHFDSEREKTYYITYTWRDTQPVGIAAKAVNHRNGAHLAYNKGRLDFCVPVSGSLVLWSINGRRIWERSLSGEVTASLPTSLSPGNYVAMVRGTVNQSLAITIYN